jgi:hypothetical protein
MTDERFEQDLQATVERLLDQRAPGELRDRVDQALSRPPVALERNHRQAWLRFAAPLAAAIAVGVIGLAVFRPLLSPVAPAGSPLAPAAVSPAPASASASVAPATVPPWASQIGLPIVTVPVEDVRSAVTADPPSAARGAPPTGPFVYLADINQRAPAVVDVGGGSVRIAGETVVHGEERVVQILSSEHWLVLEVVSAADPCVDTSPMTWRIVAAPLGSDGMPGAFTEVAKGAVKAEFQSAVVLGMNCAKEVPPPVALAGDSLAWSVQTSASLDTGSTVSIQPLNALDVAPSSFATQTYVTQLALSTEMIAWVEEENGLANGGKPVWQAFDAPMANLVARQAVDVGETPSNDHAEPPWLVLDGSVLYANLDQYAAVKGTVVRIAGGERQVIDPGRLNQNCFAVSAEAGVLLLTCQGNANATSFEFNAVWSAETGLRAVAVGPTIPGTLSAVLRPGWLVISDSVESGGRSFTAIPLSALASPGPSSAPTPSPAGTPVPSDSPPPDASPSPSSAADLYMPVVSVPGWAPTKVEVQTYVDPKSAGPLLGPFKYQDNPSLGAAIDVLDVRGGALRTIPLSLGAGEYSLGYAASASWLVIVAGSYVGDCPTDVAGVRVPWRIIVSPLGADGLPAGGYRQVAAGEVTERYRDPGIAACEFFPPDVQLDGSRLAYGVPTDAATGTPSHVVVMDLRADGQDQTVAQFSSTRQLVDLAVSSEAVAWVESGNGLTNGDKYDWAVMEARIGDAAPRQVDVTDGPERSHPAPDGIILDGTALLVTLASSPYLNLGVVLADGGVTSIIEPPNYHGVHCVGVGLTGTHAVLLCWNYNDEWLAVWSADAGLRAIGGDGTRDPGLEEWILGDRLVWDGDLVTYRSVPLSVFDLIP